MLCTRGYGGRVDRQCIKHLLDQRADVAAKDNYGNTCLHNVIISGRAGRVISREYPTVPVSDAYSTEMKNSLVLLIQAGADIYAENNYGNSMSDIAYTTKFMDTPRSAGWVWEEALSACGYDATWFREDFRRRNPAVVEDRAENSSSDETSSADKTNGISNIDGQNSESNKQDFEDLQDDELNSQSRKINIRDCSPDEGSSQDTERPFDYDMQDWNNASLQYDHPGLDPAWSGFAPGPYGIAETIDDNVNVWNQADSRPGEEDVPRPVNVVNLLQDPLPWGEDLPDADADVDFNYWV